MYIYTIILTHWSRVKTADIFADIIIECLLWNHKLYLYFLFHISLNYGPINNDKPTVVSFSLQKSPLATSIEFYSSDNV